MQVILSMHTNKPYSVLKVRKANEDESLIVDQEGK